ncbi:MAG TPA: HAMP domain-containing sensor histidine kinase [Candidatus Angelobacter sp.]|nr:HAMP domain-containing sensor histidine kinase [Candidatus Angelobacter sp.]
MRGALRRFVQRLNVRFVFALWSIALVGLVISAIAINQILPDYFREQAEERLETAALSTVLLTQTLADSFREDNPQTTLVPERRRVFIFNPAVRLAAGSVIPATVAVYDSFGLQARAAPQNVAELAAEGLRLDPELEPFEAESILEVGGPQSGEVVPFRIVISDVYTSREATLEQIRDVIAGAGVVALLVALPLGVLVARRVTAPIYRLRRVASHVAQGDLDVRAAPSGVLEVDELAAQFNVMADRLAGTLRMLEADRDRLREFVADVSHELRTPIAALRMYTELQRDGEVDEPTRREFLDRSTEQIRRLEWMSTNLLDLSRIDAGIFPLDVRRGDLRDPVQAVVQALSEVAVERNVALESIAPAHPIEQDFDRERVVQLLTNLVGNALKFTPPGGAVEVELTETDDGATLEIRDDGPGIPADELPHIFDRFYRGTNTGDARASGSGLGLAIVRSIVEMHGGQIDVASALGEGSAFRIRLPRDADGAKVNETSPSHESSDNARPIA